MFVENEKKKVYFTNLRFRNFGKGQQLESNWEILTSEILLAKSAKFQANLLTLDTQMHVCSEHVLVKFDMMKTLS